MSEVYTDQAIFDAISAAVSRARNFDATRIEIGFSASWAGF